MLPKYVNIVGKKYRVKQVYFPKDPDGNYSVGECEYTKQLITIDRRIGPAQKMETLIHEIMHAVVQEHGWKASEATVRAFIIGFYSVMKANPSIFNGRFE